MYSEVFLNRISPALKKFFKKLSLQCYLYLETKVMRLHSIVRWLKAGPPELDFLSCTKAQHLLLIWPWKSYLISQYLDFIICKTGNNSITSWDCCEEWNITWNIVLVVSIF